MPIIKNMPDKELIDLYSGFDETMVGIGTANPDIYKTPGYSKKKIQSIYIGGMSKIRYIGYELDPQPTILVLGFEQNYQSLLCVQLRYMNQKLRKAVIDFVLKTNLARIKSNLPIMVDYESLKKVVPQIKNVIRRYKIVGIKVEETVPLNEWYDVAKESSPFEYVWKGQSKEKR
jgi:hypothetical protein